MPWGPPDIGTWPPDYLGRAFVAGARWWQYEQDGFTAWPEEVDRMEAEALRRYPLGPAGHPLTCCGLPVDAVPHNDTTSIYYHRPVWRR